MSNKYDPESLFFEGHDYCVWSEHKEELTGKEESVDLYDMPPPEVYEEEKEKEQFFLTPNKLLTRLPILLAQIKAGNNSYKLKKRN